MFPLPSQDRLPVSDPDKILINTDPVRGDLSIILQKKNGELTEQHTLYNLNESARQEVLDIFQDDRCIEIVYTEKQDQGIGSMRSYGYIIS